MPISGSGFDVQKQALLVLPAQTLARNSTGIFGYLNVDGLHRIKVVWERTTGSNEVTALVLTLQGSIGADDDPNGWVTIATPATVAAGEVGQVVTYEITGNAFSVVRFLVTSDNAGATDNKFTVLLQATRY